MALLQFVWVRVGAGNAYGVHEGPQRCCAPTSLVRTIVSFIEPTHGKVLNPACGGGSMFAM